MWTLSEYENRAKTIARNFVDGSGSINDLAEKVANDAQLSPDGIRTLVRLANVCAFEGLMSKAAEEQSTDRMMEFETGDAEEVLTRLHTAVKVAQASRADSATYQRDNDFFSDVTAPTVQPEFGEKVASESPSIFDAPTPTTLPAGLSNGELRLRMDKVASAMAERKGRAQTEWFLSMEKAAQLFRVANKSPKFRVCMEKNAAATHGVAVEPELRMLQNLTKVALGTPLYGGETTEQVLSSHIPVSVSFEEQPILDTVKEAQAYRAEAHKYAAGIEWLKQNIPVRSR